MCESDDYEKCIELQPQFVSSTGDVTEEGDEVFVRGIGNKFLGVGSFAGQLVLTEATGTIVRIPIVEVQETLLSGSQVDFWSTDERLVASNRNTETYPIGIYLADLGEFDRAMNAAFEAAMGVSLD